jgi:hypothetical protein
MKITKKMAESITDILMQPKFDLLKDKKREFQNELTNAVREIIPIEVIEAFKKYPGYFKTITVEYGNYPDRNFFNLTNLPMEGYSMKLENLKGDAFDELRSKMDDLLKAKNNCDAKKNELIITIMAFSTVKNLETNFPEAFKVIPLQFYTTKTNLPVKNIENLRNWVNKEPSCTLLNN